MTLQSLINELSKLQTIHGPDVEVLVSGDDGYYVAADKAEMLPIGFGKTQKQTSLLIS